jgi:hypothetical protein
MREFGESWKGGFCLACGNVVKCVSGGHQSTIWTCQNIDCPHNDPEESFDAPPWVN